MYLDDHEILGARDSYRFWRLRSEGESVR